MPDYANGKIYKIVGEDGSVYYGSTTASLKRRLGHHRYNKGTTAYQKIISQMDWEMFLVENYPCESKKELEAREGTYIRENTCVNRQIPGRTWKERYKSNREDRILYDKERYKSHPEVKKGYYLQHRDLLVSQMKRRDAWTVSFGDSRTTNCLQRCDPSLFQ